MDSDLEVYEVYACPTGALGWKTKNRGKLIIKIEVPAIMNVIATDDTLSVDLSDGRSLSVPLARYPRLLNARTEERNNWHVIGQGHALHWEVIDEDISIENLLAGRPSGESQQSFERWLASRR